MQAAKAAAGAGKAKSRRMATRSHAVESTSAKFPAAKSTPAKSHAAKPTAAKPTAAKSHAAMPTAAMPTAGKSPADKTTPAKSVPAKSKSTKSNSTKSTPAKPTGAKSPSGKSTKGKTAAAKPIPAKSIPAKSTPAKPTEAKSPTGKTTAGRITAGRTIPGKSNAAKSSPAKPSPAKSNAAKPTAAKSNAAKSTPDKSPVAESPAAVSFAPTDRSRTAFWNLNWLSLRYEDAFPLPARRCRKEFAALFKVRFDERFPEGFAPGGSRRIRLTESLDGPGGSVDPSIRIRVDPEPAPGVPDRERSISILMEIAYGAAEELDRFSRFVGEFAYSSGSVRAHGLLPEEIRPQFQSEEVTRFKLWARDVISNGGGVPVETLVEEVEGGLRRIRGYDRSNTPSKKIPRATAALGRVGYGFAPDPRLGHRLPKYSGTAVLFEFGESVEDVDGVSPRYVRLLSELSLASFVAHANGTIGESEHRCLREWIDADRDLDRLEKIRLRANLDWIRNQPRFKSSAVDEIRRDGNGDMSRARNLLIAVALSDGTSHSKMASKVEDAYRMLGLDPQKAYSDLHAGEVQDSPRTVLGARPGSPGEKIPRQSKRPKATKLDAKRVARIKSDTEQASLMLGEIFDEEDPGAAAAPSRGDVPPDGLDRKHAALVRDLIERPHWTEDELTEICSRHALLASGALETVNEWAFDVHDEALLEEDDGYHLVPETAEAVRITLAKEKQHVATQTP